MIKTALLNFVKIFHNLLVFFIVFGVFVPKKYLIYFLFVWPIVFIHWQTNSNRCVLTELEYWLEGKPYPKSQTNSANVLKADPPSPFIRKITGTLFDGFTDGELHKTILGLFTLFWVIGLIRYLM